MEEKKTIVPHLADLARLELGAAEEVVYAKQLDDIIGYVGKISGVKTSSQPLTTTISGVRNVLRNDEVDQTNLADELLACASKTRGRLVLVPKIL